MVFTTSPTHADWNLNPARCADFSHVAGFGFVVIRKYDAVITRIPNCIGIHRQEIRLLWNRFLRLRLFVKHEVNPDAEQNEHQEIDQMALNVLRHSVSPYSQSPSNPHDPTAL
jgi:hypothetical protein